MKLLAILLITFSVSCAATPIDQKPVIEIGIIDYARLHAITGYPGSGKITRVPLYLYDRAVCFKPDEWRRFHDYLDALENYVEVYGSK